MDDMEEFEWERHRTELDKIFFKDFSLVPRCCSKHFREWLESRQPVLDENSRQGHINYCSPSPALNHHLICRHSGHFMPPTLTQGYLHFV